MTSTLAFFRRFARSSDVGDDQVPAAWRTSSMVSSSAGSTSAGKDTAYSFGWFVLTEQPPLLPCSPADRSRTRASRHPDAPAARYRAAG